MKTKYNENVRLRMNAVALWAAVCFGSYPKLGLVACFFLNMRNCYK